MQVTIKHAYLGVKFISPSGAELSVCMRDDGFELITDKDQKVDLYERKKHAIQWHDSRGRRSNARHKNV